MPNLDTREHVLQAFRTALSGFLCLILARWMHLPEPYWAAISSVIVMYSDWTKTVAASWNRIVGTAIGVIIGAGLTTLFGARAWAFALGVAITVLICVWLRLEDASRLASVAVAVVMLIPHPGRPWVIALHRFAEVSLGIIVATCISGASRRLSHKRMAA
jgi:uncharacterized membrane protein YgaE (UPF0421/DUF939 family)